MNFSRVTGGGSFPRVGTHRAARKAGKLRGHTSVRRLRTLNATTKSVLEGVPFTEEHHGEPLSVHNTVRRYHDSLSHCVRQRLWTPVAANDVAREADVRMLQSHNSRQLRSPSSMLFRIAFNVANDFGRSEQVRRVADQC